MNILVIDDNATVGSIVSRIAAQGGWNTMFVTETANIVAVVRTNQVDVILLDFMMPQRDGLETLAMIREAGLDVGVIMFSGDVSRIDRKRAEELGVFKILAKPLSMPELRNSLNEIKRQRAALPKTA